MSVSMSMFCFLFLWSPGKISSRLLTESTVWSKQTPSSYCNCSASPKLPSGQLSNLTLYQSPPQIVEEGAEVRIDCSHNDKTFSLMLWYQQRQDSRSLTLIGYGYGSGVQNYESGFKDQFELRSEDLVTGTLIVRSAKLSHSAVYLCAVRAQCCGSVTHPHKKASVCFPVSCRGAYLCSSGPIFPTLFVWLGNTGPFF